MSDTSARLSAALHDRYRIERELGSGGMATVYLAEDLRHSRKVAIKVLREDLAASMGANRFLREIQIAAQLQHPNILPLLDSGEADGLLYFVMPYVPGQSLRERLAREGELPVHEAVRLLVEVTDALAHSHQMGVVHRDIKPDNVMMSGRHALVTDFGVAKAISEATGRNTITTLGVALGTPTYMSPEQAAADPLIDHRSDIYAVGVMAYEMLTGRPPFTGATPQQVLAAHVTEAPDPVSKRRQAISPALEQIVMRCLAKRPADRYQTAEELLHALEAQATPSTGVTPTQTRPVTGVAPGATGRTRMTAAAVAVLAIAAAAFLLGRRGDVAPAPGVSLTRVRATFSGTAEFATALSPDGERVAYADRVCGEEYLCTYDLVVQEVGGAGISRVVEGMQAIYDIKWSGNGRTLLVGGLQPGGQVAYYAVPALGGAAPRFISSSAVRMFGNGDSVLIGTHAGPDRLSIRSTTLANPTRGPTVEVVRGGMQPFGWSVTPDGKWLSVVLAFGSVERLITLDRDGVARDSLEVAGVGAGGFIGPDRLVIGLADPATPGLLRVVERRIAADGRWRPEVVELATSVPGVGFAVTPGGISYLDGTTQAGVIAIARDAVGGPITTRQVATSTGFLSALMGSDGSYVILERHDPADPDATRLSVQPFAGGEERPIGTAQLNMGALRSRTVDGSGIVVLERNGEETTITETELATGRITDRGTMPDQGEISALEAMADGSLAWRPEGATDQIRIRHPSGEIRTVQTNGIVTETIEDSPDGHGLIGWGFALPNLDSVAVWHLPPGATTVRPLLRAVFDYVAGHHWLPDGNAELVINETLSTSAFYHLDVASGRLERQGTIPINFINAVSFSNDGRRLTARTRVPTQDVWTLRRP